MVEEQKKYQLLSEALDVDVKDISPETKLESMDEWDSLGKLAVSSMLSSDFGKTLSMSKLRDFDTIQDILSEME